MKRLLLVRHGETEWNSARRLQGQTDISLSDVGRKQARALAPMIVDLRPDLAVSSDLSRAMETAHLLGLSARSEQRLREQDLGGWSGRGIAEILAEAPADYHAWRAGGFTPEGAETWKVFRERVAAAVSNAAESAQQTALVVCHGGVIRAAIEALLGLPPSKIIPVAPASLTIIALTESGPRLEVFNVRPGSVEIDAPD